MAPKEDVHDTQPPWFQRSAAPQQHKPQALFGSSNPHAPWHPGAPTEIRSACDEDQAIRLFQDTIEILVLEEAGRDLAERILPAAGRQWLTDLAVLTGIPSAAGIPTGRAQAVPQLPELVFNPTTVQLRDLREAHRELRRQLAAAGGSAAAAEIRGCLAVLGAIGTALRRAGLAPAYRAAARLAARQEDAGR